MRQLIQNLISYLYYLFADLFRARKNPVPSFRLNVHYYERYPGNYLELPNEPFKVAVEKEGENEYVIGAVFLGDLFPLTSFITDRYVRTKVRIVDNLNLPIEGKDLPKVRFFNKYLQKKNIRFAVREVIHGTPRSPPVSDPSGQACPLRQKPKKKRFGLF